MTNRRHFLRILPEGLQTTYPTIPNHSSRARPAAGGYEDHKIERGNPDSGMG